MILKILICLGIIFVLWVGHVRAAECYKYNDPMERMLCLTQDTNTVVTNFQDRLIRLEYIVYALGALVLGMGGLGRHLLLKWLETKINGGKKYPMNEIDWTSKKGK